MEARLKYFADTYYGLDFDLRAESAQGFDFERLRDVVKRHIRILQFPAVEPAGSRIIQFSMEERWLRRV